MGRKCFVPMCTSGYISNKEKISLFAAPNDKKLLITWQSKISRKDRELTAKDHVCEKHFREEDIIREWTCGGKTFQFKIPKLRKDALPYIFHNCPTYLTKQTVKRRKIIKQDDSLKKLKRSEDSSILTSDSEPVLIGQESEQPEPAPTSTLEILSISGGIDNNLLFSKLCNSNLNIPDLWSIVKIDGKEKNISFGKYFLTRQGIPTAERQAVIKEDLTIAYIIYSKILTPNTFPNVISSIKELENILLKLDKLQLCIGGGNIDDYSPNLYSETTQGKYIDASNNVWRHSKCSIYISSKRMGIVRCKFCRLLSKNLMTQKKNKSKNATISTLKLKKRCDRQKITRLQRKVQLLSRHLNEIKDKISQVEKISIQEKLKEMGMGEMQQTLIMECVKLCKTKHKNSQKYNENWLMICLLIHTKNPNSYRFLRDNNILPLPCPRTISRYFSMMKLKCGIDEEPKTIIQ